MTEVWVRTGSPYAARIGRGLLARLGGWLAAEGAPCRAAVIADDTVAALYGAQALDSLRGAGFEACLYAFPHGEANKSLATWAALLNFLCESGLTRGDVIVALGGGVTGDLAGFAAACYLRGVRYAQAPTTLLAMADSAVGGKTGVDLPAGKNLCGAFWQPSLVVCDTAALDTLPENELANGLAECVKHGVLADEALFALLESGGARAQIERVVARSMEIKADYVARDERDLGVRRLLNLGHTLGHAAETVSGYALSHGQAVSLGMVWAARIACSMGLCGEGVPRRIAACLASLGLPTRAELDPDELARAALHDKKRAGDTLVLALPEAVGRCVLRPVPASELPALTALALRG